MAPEAFIDGTSRPADVEQAHAALARDAGVSVDGEACEAGAGR